MGASLRDQFEVDGFVRVESGLAPELLAAVRHRMDEAAAGLEPRSTLKLGDDAEAAALITSAPLRAAFDALLGSGGWIEPGVLEDLRMKLPSQPQPTWWHVDVFERGPQTRDEEVLTWRASPRCGGVGLLVLLLLSDVGADDGATALRAGSQRAVARRLAAVGDDGLSLGELLDLKIDAETAGATVGLTTGPAGTAFLCHPMLVHAAQAHTGAGPSYWALPAIRLAGSHP